MDTKSLAKSKRAHSLHHSKKHHPKQTSKGPSVNSIGIPNKGKAPGKETKEKAVQSKGSSSLPSNWDRYTDDYDLSTRDASQYYTSQPSDIVVPKSKGADYSYLISEAKSQYQTNFTSDMFPSFDELIDDLNQGQDSLHSVRGESILSWIEGDTFMVEDKAAGGLEDSFFSLDLDALANQLAKVELSKRLFIEADLLPPELGAERLQVTHQPSKDHGAHGNRETKRPPHESLDELSKSSNPLIYVTTRFSRGDEITVSKPPEEEKNANRSENGLGFKVNAAETDLDLLLGPFSETKIHDSSTLIEKSKYSSYVSGGQVSTSSFNKGQDSSTSAIASHFDDTLDDLLAETSRKDSSTSVAIPVDFDDTLDDLLAKTSGLPKQTEVLTDIKDPHHLPSPSSGSKSNLIDEFDSWLDTI